MARQHLSTGDTVTLVEAGGKPIFITSALVLTDHVNDGALQINDSKGPFFARALPIPGETGHGGFVTLNEPAFPSDTIPVTATLTGTGTKATVFFRPRV